MSRHRRDGFWRRAWREWRALMAWKPDGPLWKEHHDR